MRTYILWTISGIQGPGGSETLRFSNLPYQIDSGPNVGETFRASWKLSSFSSFSLVKTAHQITSDGVLVVGGLTAYSPTPVEVVNNFTSSTAAERELSYLFSSAYDLSSAEVVGESADSYDGNPPTYSSFTPFFTGRLSQRPNRSADSVTWYFSPRTSETDGPLLTERFTGMGAHLQFTLQDPLSHPSPASMIGGNWSIQTFLALESGLAAIGNQEIYRVEDSLGNPLISLYVLNDDVWLDINYGIGTDTYLIWDRPPAALGSGYFAWIEIAWDQSGGTFSAWADGEITVDAEAILNNPSGVEDETVIGDIEDTTILRLSALRLYNVALTENGFSARRGPIDYVDDEPIIYNAWEFDDGLGDAATDYGPRRDHLVVTSTPTWEFRGVDGDRSQADTIIPLVLGSCFSVPVLMINPKKPQGAISAAGGVGGGQGGVQTARSKGVPLSNTPQYIAGTYSFDHTTGAITPASGLFGRLLVIDDTLVVSSAFDGQYDGTYTVRSILPPNVGVLSRQGTNDFYGVVVEEHSWTSSGTGVATIRGDFPQRNWTEDIETSPYPLAETGLLAIQYSHLYPQPLSVDCVGDERLYTTGNPTAYAPPDDIYNVLLQALKSYGPKWDDVTMPPASYGSIPGRVGYYVSGEQTAREVVDDISKGSGVWVEEDGDGVISAHQFIFPEALVDAEEIYAADVIYSSVSDHRIASSRTRARTPWLTSLVLAYLHAWSSVPESDIPQVVDSLTRSLVSKDWREIICGDPGTVTTKTPKFYTYEARRFYAKGIGDAILRLSQGEVAELEIRMTPEEQKTRHLTGTKAVGDLTDVGLGDTDRIVIGRSMNFGQGTLGLALWYEPQ